MTTQTMRLVATDIPNPMDGGWCYVTMRRPRRWEYAYRFATLFFSLWLGCGLNMITAAEVCWGLNNPTTFRHNLEVWKHGKELA